jgi:DNA-directed RNA polymerase subunit RPC12/RpoP
MLRARKVTCEQCGASIRLSTSIRFVTCRYCGSTLEMIQKVAKPSLSDTKPGPAEPASVDEIALLRLETELSRVEAEWERKRQSLLVRDENGNAYEPDDPQGILLSILTVAGGILIPVFTGLSFASSGFGILLAVAGFVLLAHARSKASDFTRLRKHYSAERMRIVSQISRLRNGSPTLRARLRERLFRKRPQVVPKGALVPQRSHLPKDE